MDIKTKIIKGLNIEDNEVAPVLLLIVQSIFIGVFYGAFDIGAHTLFLKTFPESMIAKAYVLSGIVGIVLTWFFSKLQSKIAFSTLAKYTLLFIAILTFVMRLAFEFTDANWTIMVVFILLGPLNILAILSFWGTVSRIFSLRQGKRLFGIIDAGQIFGIIISSFVIPLIIALLNGTKNLLIISAVSIFIAMFLEIIISYRYKIDNEYSDTEEGQRIGKKESTIKVSKFIKDPYILFMALFVVFSMFAAFFVQYSFLVVTNENYPGEQDLAKFLGYFNTVMMVFTLLIKTFVYSKLVKTYGLKISLLLSSLLLALFTAIAIVSGYIAGYNLHATGFVYFFLFISLSKLFNKTLKDSLEIPSFKLLYQSLNKKIRYDVQAKIDGTVNEISALISGVLLSVLGFLAFVEIIHYSIVLFIILIGWTIITFKLYKEYKGSLEKALSKTKDIITSSSNKVFDIVTESRLKIVNSYMPLDYTVELNRYLNSSTPQQIESFEIKIEAFMAAKLGNISSEWNDWISAIPLDDKKIYSSNEISYAFSSSNINESYLVLNYIFNVEHKNQHTILSNLLRMPEIITKRVAIKLCGYLQHVEMISSLADFIDDEYLMGETYITLSKLVKKGYKQLMQVYYRTDISELSQLIIIDVLSNVNNKEVIHFLFTTLSDYRSAIVNQSLKSMQILNFQMPEDDVHKMFPFIKVEAHVMAWDFAILNILKNEYDDSMLLESFLDDMQKHKVKLFDLLRITYDKHSVNHVYDYLEEDSSESIGYGLELFDLFISEEIKAYLILLFEEVPMADKVFQLQEHFSIPSLDSISVLIDIINKNPNIVSTRTKLQALLEFDNKNVDVTDDIVSQLFNSNVEIKELAAAIIYKTDKLKMKQIIKRLDIKSQIYINRKIEEKSLQENFEDFYKLKYKLAKKWKAEEVFESFESIKFDKHKNIDVNSLTNNYFVLLKINQFSEALNEDWDIESNFIYKTNLMSDNEIGSVSYLLGITRKSMNMLAIIQKEYVRLLINKAL